jgi:hypothetical protein
VKPTNAQKRIPRDARDTFLRHFSRAAEMALSNSRCSANQWQCELACGEFALPLIAGFVHLTGAQNPQSISN